MYTTVEDTKPPGRELDSKDIQYRLPQQATLAPVDKVGEAFVGRALARRQEEALHLVIINVAQHSSPTVDPEGYVRMLAEDAKGAIEYLEQAPPDFDDVFSSAVAALQGRSIIDPSAESEATWQSYVTAAQVGAALFSAASSSKGVVHELISGSPRSIASTGPQAYADAATWVDSFWLAVICRDRDKANMLADIPVSLLRASGAACDPYIYDWVETLQAFWRGDPDGALGDRLAAAVEGCAPSALRIIEAEQALKIVHPPLQLFYRFILLDQEGFNTALVEALELHKSFYTATEDRASEIQGLVPLQILAITCLGYEAGLSVEVESDYIPLRFVQGTWLDVPPS